VMTARVYATPDAFREALEHRPRATAGAKVARQRQLVVFDRFLARIVDVLGDDVTLKGGLVLELRLSRARATRDLDLRVVGPRDETLAKLREAARRSRNWRYSSA
jgi:hypothetical protein